MLKWTARDGTTSGLAVRHAVGDFRGLRATDATADDIVACLRANPCAATEVLLGVSVDADEFDRELVLANRRAESAAHDHAAAVARASQAERSLATVTAERDEAHAALRDCATRLGNGSAVSAQASHAFHCQVPTEVGIAVDALKAKIAEAGRMRDTLGRRIDEVQAALNECGAGFTGQKESTRIRALRARLAESTEWGSRACEVLGYVLGTLNLCDEQHWAFDPLNVEPVKDKAFAVRLLVRDLRAQLAKTEAVVKDFAEYDCEYNDNCPVFGSRHGRCVGCKARSALDALRALDSPVGVATTAEGGHEDHPRAIVDSDTARVGAADSTPGLSRLASAEPGDTGPNPVRAGSSGTPGPTGGAIPPAGAKCGEWGCALPSGHGGVHGPWAPGEPDPQAPATRAERCTTFCVEDSATCRRRAGHSGQHAASLNVARQLDETVTRAELDELRRRVERLESLTNEE